MNEEDELEIKFTELARRQFARLDKQVQEDVATKIGQHRHDPLFGATKIKIPKLRAIGQYAWRAGKLRIFFDLNKKDRRITIKKIDARSESYKSGRRK